MSGIPDSNVNRTETRRTISPFDLTAADNPGAIISYPLLNGPNYDEWAISFKTALSSRKKFGFLDGTITKPTEDSADYDDWHPVNALLVSWIKMTIHESIRSNISHREEAKDLWDNLKERFSLSSGPKYQHIKAELAACKQQGQSIEVYYGRLTKIWDVMAMLRPLRKCDCGSNKVLEQQEKDRNDDKVQDFLYGVDESFQTIRSNIVARVPLPSLAETYNLLRQEEDLQRRTRPRDAGPDAMAFAVQTKQPSRDDRDKSPADRVCTHCKRKGHTVAQCFALVGYPEWWGDRPKFRSRDKPPSSSQPRAQANAVITQKSVASPVITDNDKDGISGLSTGQWEAIMKLLNAAKPTASEQLTGMISFSWILDTGCTHHMTGTREHLFDIRNIEPVMVVLADGNERLALQAGTVRLSSQLVLKSVYLVDGLQSDLISVGQLLDENKSIIQMTDKFLLIQDRSTKMVIRVGKRQAGTFVFRGMEIAAVSTTRNEVQSELWHKRYGHPSDKALKAVSDISVSSLHKACEICLRAKKTRNSFPLSSNKAAEPFDLIHVDV